MSSFIISLSASAIGCRSPWGPTRWGPMRDCMRAANLRSSSVTYVTIPMTALSRMKAASASSASGGMALAVDLAEDGVDGAHDRDDVGDLAARDDVRKDREVRERRAADLHAIRFRSAVAHDVEADLAARALDARVAFALRHAHLPDRPHAGPRGDRPFRQPVEPLAHG